MCLKIHICGLQLVHPFYYLETDTPIIGGNDLLVTARIVLNPHEHQVWSVHPAAVEHVPWLKAMITYQPSSPPTARKFSLGRVTPPADNSTDDTDSDTQVKTI